MISEPDASIAEENVSLGVQPTKRWQDIVGGRIGWDSIAPLVDGWIGRSSLPISLIGGLIGAYERVIVPLLGMLPPAVTVALPEMLDRLSSAYIGFVLLALASIIFRIFKPEPLCMGPHKFDYVERALQHYTPNDFQQIANFLAKDDDKKWLKVIGRVNYRASRNSFIKWDEERKHHRDALEMLLREHFTVRMRSYTTARAACMVFWAAGMFLLVAPTILLFFKLIIPAILTAILTYNLIAAESIRQIFEQIISFYG